VENHNLFWNNFWRNLFFRLGLARPKWQAGPNRPCGLTQLSHARVKFYATRAWDSAKVIILPSHCSSFVFLQITVINRAKTKWRSFGLLSSPVFFCFSRKTWRQLLRRKDMSIPASGERKSMVVLTSPAVFAFWLRRSVSSTIVPLLFDFYILMWPSFVFPEFSIVFSPLFFFLLSRFPCLVLFSLPLCLVFLLFVPPIFFYPSLLWLL